MVPRKQKKGRRPEADSHRSQKQAETADTVRRDSHEQLCEDQCNGGVRPVSISADSGGCRWLPTAARFAIRTPTVGEQIVNAPGPLSTGWHHMAVVIDSANMTLRLYQDGTLVSSAATTVLPKDMAMATQNWLGRSQYAVDPYFAGSLDDFCIYDRALSEAEIRYLAGDR